MRSLVQDPDLSIIGLDNLSVGNTDELSKLCTLREWTPDMPPLAQGEVALMIGDITDPAAVAQAVDGVDVVVHLAADSGVMTSLAAPLANFHSNVLGTLTVLDAIRSHPKTSFIMASTGAALGQQVPPVHEQQVARPISPYGAGKLAAEAYCFGYAGSYGLRTCILRFSNVYGPHSSQKTSVVAKFIRQMLAGETISIFGDGKQTRDFIYIEDLVEAIRIAVQTKQSGEVFHIANHKETTIDEVVTELTQLLSPHGIQPKVEYANSRAGEIVRNYVSIDKAKRVLGWSPRHTFAEGLEKTVAWFLAERKA